MNRMKIPLAAAAAVTVLAAAADVEVDGIAATIGDVSVLRSEVRGEMRRAGVADESRFGEFLDKFVERALIMKAAAGSKMTMQEWVVDDRVRTIVEEVFGGDRNKLVESLAAQKMPYSDWRRRIREDLVVNAMRWNVVDRNVRASPAAMKAEYRDHPERYRSNDRVTVSVIVLKPENAELREVVSKGLAEGVSFADLARRHSADARAADGGVRRNVRPRDEFRAEICDVIERMGTGEISDWIELDGWSFLIRKDEASESQTLSFAEAYDAIEANVKKAESKRLYREWIERLKADTYIKVY